ncbi:MAG: hypothetical protein COS99_06125 [Candidatus Omnitrophica bacterium CG07_land_8_20_14_0_80_42_15]|uniref:Insulinase family protein n=1 Tax=Candidatus Aquitaenariimonas noxiae TaxID=1974741 RepID=A0A2J0KU05_9BACT|nr:MAG: hypothetical protein COS99_06125 [Candidatus Omnitrophica bacterium CG07_land_8_20_14_0_80_42_15]
MKGRMNRFISYTGIFLVLACMNLPNPAHAAVACEKTVKEEHARREVLSNGLTLLVKEVHTLPIVSIEARFRIGSADEGKWAGSGISHFVEHMLFKGTPTRKHGDIEREIKSYGGTINGFTSFDSTGYTLTVESKYLKEAIRLLVNAVMNPAFEEKELEKEREVILKEIKLQNDNPDEYSMQLLWSAIYTTHPYKYPIIGYKDLVRKLKREDLLSFHNQYYTPNKLVFGVCGDVDTAVVQKEVESAFKNYKMRFYETQALPQEGQQIAIREHEERADVNLSRFLIGYHSIPVSHQDLFALDVLASILGDGESSILYKTLVDRRLAYSVGAYNYTPKDPGIFFISILLNEENIPGVAKELDRVIGVIKSGKVDEGQLDKAKNITLVDYVLSHETIEAQAKDMVTGEILVNDPDFSSRYLEGIKNVNSKDVARVANLYLKNNTETMIYLLPKSAKTDDIKKEVSGIKSDIVVEKYELENGMRVIIREDHSLPVVAIDAVFQGGLRVENAHNNGISNITSEISLRGTKNRTKDEIYGSIEKLGGSISNISGNNSFGVTLTILSENLDFGLDLLSDILLNPTFPEAELDNIKSLTLAAIKNREDDIFESGIKLFKQNLYKDHPYRFTVIGEKETVENVKREHLVKFYKQFYVPKNLVLALFGDFDKEKTLAKVKALFKDFKGELPSELSGETPKVEPIKAAIAKFMEKEQVVIVAGLKTTKITDPDIYALSVLASILAGSDGRLFYDVRDKLGISYTQGAMTVPGVDPGYFLFYIATSKEHLEDGKELIIDEVKKLQKNSVTEEELKLAKADLVGSKLRSLQSNQGLAFTSSLDELYGLGYDNFKKFASQIESVTKADMDRIVNKYFNIKDLVIVSVGPVHDAN